MQDLQVVAPLPKGLSSLHRCLSWALNIRCQNIGMPHPLFVVGAKFCKSLTPPRTRSLLHLSLPSSPLPALVSSFSSWEKLCLTLLESIFPILRHILTPSQHKQLLEHGDFMIGNALALSHVDFLVSIVPVVSCWKAFQHCVASCSITCIS